MRKRRLEIAVLVALLVFGSIERPTTGRAAVELTTTAYQPDLYQVSGFAPQPVETIVDLGLIAVKLSVSWLIGLRV